LKSAEQAERNRHNPKLFKQKV